MSDEQPTEPRVPLEPTQPLEPFDDVETVGPAPARQRARGAIVAGVAVAVAALLGGGAYAAYSFLDGGGLQPADVLPASTIAVVSIDLDPSAGQKIAAIKTIRRFPSLKKELGLQADDDLRQYVFDKIISEGDCKGLDFEHDVKPWVGKRAAFAGVDLGEKNPTPVIALQISDPAKAKAGFDAIVKCTATKDFAFVVGDDYLVGSDTVGHAQQILAKGKERPLADDAAYQKWTDEVGDPGFLNFYVAKKAAVYAEDLLDELSGGFTDSLVGDASSSDFSEDFSSDFGSDPGSVAASGDSTDPGETSSDDPGTDDSGTDDSGTDDSGSPDPLASAKDALKNFQGLGGTLRFDDGGMELSLATGGVDNVADSASGGRAVGDLPADTAVALGFGVSRHYAEDLLNRMGGDADDFAKEAQEQAGLDLPEDLQTLMGTAMTLSLDGEAPHSLDAIQGPEDVPVGLVIHGDAAKIRAIITKVEDHTGMKLSDIPLNVSDADGKVAIGPGDYAEGELLKDGALGSVGDFTDAVPDADKASAVLYIDFNSRWRDLLVDAVTQDESSGSGREVDENTRPLRGLGVSTWVDGSVTHALFKLTTD